MKIVLLSLFCCCALFFAGCPQYLVQQADKYLPPKGYKPRYMTSGVRFDTLAKQYAEKVRRGEIDTTKLYDEEEEITATSPSKPDSAQKEKLPNTKSEAQQPDSKTSPSTSQDSSSSGSKVQRRDRDTLYHKQTEWGLGSRTVTVIGKKKTEDSLLAVLANKAPVGVQVRSLEDKRYPDEIEIRATVFDSTGRFIMGLAPPRFSGRGTYRDYWRTLSDSCNGVRTQIDSFTVTEVRENVKEPHAIAFVIDHSGSMGEDRILRLREAVRKTMDIVSTGDMVCVIPFAGTVKVEVPLSRDSADYKGKFDIEGNAKVKGGTSIFDAVDVAAKELMKAPEHYKRAMILFTDGEDNTSKNTLNNACRTAREKNIPVYAIAYGLSNEEQLEKLSGLTKGRLYRIYSTREFPYVFMDIYRSLKTYYRISYKPPKCNGVHHAKFTLSVPELGIKRLIGRGMYDKSLFTELDTVGTIAFVNIEFETGKAVIQPQSMPLLEQVATALRANPDIEMEIRGHTDNRGSDELNTKLSKQRAIAVATALTTMGIGTQRLRTAGFGSSRPLVPNDSDENRAKNRRTEFVITRK